MEEALCLAASRPSVMCVICVLRFEPRYPVWCVSGPGCFARTCSLECFRKHKASQRKVPIGGHAQLGLLELGPHCGIAEAVLSMGVRVVSLGVNAQAVSPQVVLVINNCPALLLSNGKIAKYGVAGD